MINLLEQILGFTLLILAFVKLFLPLWLDCLDIVKNYLDTLIEQYLPQEQESSHIDVIIEVAYGSVQVSLKEKDIENPLILSAVLKPDDADGLADQIKKLSDIARGR